MKIHYIGLDGFGRPVFKDDSGRFYKTVAPCYEFERMSVDDQNFVMKDIHTTSEFEGEPGFPCWKSDMKIFTV
jgi:hypothetical protein